MTPRSWPSSPYRTLLSTPQSSSNFQAMGATCCPCPSLRSARSCQETWAAVCCQGASRSPSPWWPSLQNSSPCRVGLPKRPWRRSLTGGVWWRVPRGLACALSSWWPVSWSSSWALCYTICLASPSASLWYPVVEACHRDASCGYQLKGWAGVGDGIPVMRWGWHWPFGASAGLWLATWFTCRQEQRVRSQQDPRRTVWRRWQLWRWVHASS